MTMTLLRAGSVAAAILFGLGMGPALAQQNGTDGQDRPNRQQAIQEAGVDWEAVRQSLRERRLRRLERVGGLRRLRDVATANEPCHVPILLPSDDLQDESVGTEELARRRLAMRVFPRRDFYAAFIQRDGHSVEIIGTRLARTDRPRMESMRQRMRNRNDQDYVITQSDYGIELSFSRFNVAYTISILCDEPEGNTSCTEEGYILSIWDSLAFAGGTPESGEEIDEGLAVGEDETQGE